MIICGLPGVGKSTLAKNLAPMINATVLSSDKIRKELFPNPTYSPFERKLVYDAMIILAKYLNEVRCNCILDATFNREDSRVEIKEKLQLNDREFQIIECFCPEEVVISRLKSRKDDYSDATIEVYQKMKKIYELVKVEHISVDTTLDPQENSHSIIEEIKRKQ
ncbi:AAA family ATPase [Candidatus Nitrosotalea bavarica]|uniref:AAA family ATPase n=1 Tax=Candidatus Nitrosotalea bavarica TaxID=1903277 RepID=UPI0013FDD685|nr:AAA family ATPase [Candidatus Nitrosotalea bavarica]